MEGSPTAAGRAEIDFLFQEEALRGFSGVDLAVLVDGAGPAVVDHEDRRGERVALRVLLEQNEVDIASAAGFAARIGKGGGHLECSVDSDAVAENPPAAPKTT